MSLLKYIERLKRMDDLIRRKSTGRAQEFANKLGISQSQLYEDLKEIRQLGAPVEYCGVRKSYIYTTDTRLIFSFRNEFENIKGGKNNFGDSSITGVPTFMFGL